MSKSDPKENLLKSKTSVRISRGKRSNSYEVWRRELAVIKTERIGQRMVAIRTAIHIICLILLLWYSTNIITLIVVIINEKPDHLVHMLGVVNNIIVIMSLIVLQFSVKSKSIAINTINLTIIWFYLMAIFSMNVILLMYLFGIGSQSDFIRERIIEFHLNFHKIDLISAVFLFVFYLILINLLYLMRGLIFDLIKIKDLEKSDKNTDNSTEDKRKTKQNPESI